MLDLADVAERLGVSKRTVTKYIKERGLPCASLGHRTRRVRLGDLLKWISSQTTVLGEEPHVN